MLSTTTFKPDQKLLFCQCIYEVLLVRY